METGYETIGQRIAKRRAKMGMRSQEELAKALSEAEHVNFSRELITKWENGKRNINTDQLLALAKVLGCSSDYLLGLDPLPTPAKTDINKELGFSNSVIEKLSSVYTSYKENSRLYGERYEQICDEPDYQFDDALTTYSHEWNTARGCLNFLSFLIETKYSFANLGNYFGKLIDNHVHDFNNSETHDLLRYYLNRAFEAFLDSVDNRMEKYMAEHPPEGLEDQENWINSPEYLELVSAWAEDYSNNSSKPKAKTSIDASSSKNQEE